MEKMKMKIEKVYIMNSPVITDYGVFKYEKLDIEDAKELLNEYNYISAIGHKATAEVMSKLLNHKIPVNRISIKNGLFDVVIAFRFLTRISEGQILTEEQMLNLPYELGLITRLE